MPDQFQFDVFLSHSSKDKAAVRQVQVLDPSSAKAPALP